MLRGTQDDSPEAQHVIEDWLNQHSSFQLPGDTEAVVFPLTFMPQHQQASCGYYAQPVRGADPPATAAHSRHMQWSLLPSPQRSAALSCSAERVATTTTVAAASTAQVRAALVAAGETAVGPFQAAASRLQGQVSKGLGPQPSASPAGMPQEGEVRHGESGTLLGLLVVEGTRLGTAAASLDQEEQQPPVALAPPAAVDCTAAALAALLLEQVPSLDAFIPTPRSAGGGGGGCIWQDVCLVGLDADVADGGRGCVPDPGLGGRSFVRGLRGTSWPAL